MKRIVALLLCMLCILCACGKGDTKKYTPKYISIPMGNDVFTFELPKVSVVETDNNVYWKFSDDVVLYVAATHSTVLEEQYKDTDVYTGKNSVSRTINDKFAISMSGDGSALEKYPEYLAKGTTKESKLPTKEDNLKSLPTFSNKTDMSITENGLYMPNGAKATSSIYRAEIVCKDGEYLESFILDGKLEDIQDSLKTIASCNATGVAKLYVSPDVKDRIFFYAVGNHIVVAKALSMNQWCVYNCTTAFADYALTGVVSVSK